MIVLNFNAKNITDIVLITIVYSLFPFNLYTNPNCR